MGLQKNFADLKASFKRPSKANEPKLSAAEYERLRLELEDILTLYEPSQIGTAATLLKHYDGLEAELVDCYRAYYMKESRSSDPDDDEHPNQMAVPTYGSGNNDLEDHKSRFATAAALRKRLALSSLSSLVPSKLRVRSAKMHKPSSATKMDSIRGPDVWPETSPPKPSGAPAHGFRLPKKTTLVELLQKVKLSRDATQPLEPDAAPLQATTMSFPARCLDTGEHYFMDEVNHEVLARQKDAQYNKRKSFRNKVIVFLQQYDMAAVDSVDTLLSYGGKTNDEIWDDLHIQYKVNQRSRLLQLFQTYDPAHVADVDALLVEYAANVEDMIAFYKAKFAVQKSKVGKRNDPCTWTPGEPNSYQLLPTGL
ncbi:hypothetical protein SPRG_17224 [Saprolegnia parasitica CBS 223.65]|uniref:Uncharacterized protein n=1 Tax=Saprolegnia parasitica (strain CBS 223.65) TaxID=695850 RepID=A0A067BSA2_SAPPC|nr:hypothetical protein SPRG_17224 [Saprolegnia parasitica CBS 223.65]KDO17161.1 hypothetical protein SPRG_17224 [Saprolegnia parasitica CBS 223.65]|eukprot:XP_012212130.1 hypothetical protein SPRG_17224 [Saprolegnia parasitica CBS 223.65]